MNPYITLNISETASDDEIKQQYRILAQLHHPDRGGDEEVFKNIKLAYEILSDPVRRKMFDSTGETHRSLDIKSESMNMLSQMIFVTLQNFKIDSDNLIFNLEQEILKLKGIALYDTGIANTHITNINYIIEKIRIKTDRENLIVGILNTQIAIRTNDIKTFSHRIEVCDMMSNILQDYEYGLVKLPI